MKITLRFFASVREALGMSQEVLELDAPLATVGELRVVLIARGGAWAEALGEGRALRMACNQVMCHADTPLPDACEVAFFPPVTGG
ncbi:molybdopterin converting factor subunit 1 [Janthinobacterium agaricidamnosum]|uniref:Molybdopterin converting factor, subunit 1 n=1 Tax=Janthinobacterium agaricidamnosum NBRC 102515 = DSM 9628 TaxID=1349767 RepID=W0V6N8_9BURK|nr:molybdopterin converting factor subunit 1 [Janthinobacterium agaricidamnosum]CDG83008.1 molybdopterin converting factor, subunit 1 [Janthinobacterium agaricidamnosum NBRC 102515 = DSM 9628]